MNDDNYLRQRILDVLNEKIALGYARKSRAKSAPARKKKATRKPTRKAKSQALKRKGGVVAFGRKPAKKATRKSKAPKRAGVRAGVRAGARKQMTREEHKLAYKKKHDNLRGETEAWRKLLEKRRKDKKAKEGGVVAFGRKPAKKSYLKARGNDYINFLKNYAMKNNLSYRDAMQDVKAKGLWK